MKYIKVQFTGEINTQGYQIIDDALTNVIGYIYLDGTDIDLTNMVYCCNIIDDTILTLEDIIVGSLWHDLTCSIRIKISNNNNLLMLQSYPELGVYIKTNGINSFIENGQTYIYVNTILPEHRALLEAYGATIIEK